MGNIVNNYNIDIVLCIDKTGSMHYIVDEIRYTLHSLCAQMLETMEFSGKEVEKLRIKVIAFGDYLCDQEPMLETQFFNIPDEEYDLLNFLEKLEVRGGGDCPEDALQALALALKSDWTLDGSKRRHIVMMFSDAPAHDLKEHADCIGYLEDMPIDLNHLAGWWHGTNCTLNSTYSARSGRLVLFVPQCEPWEEIMTWSGTFGVFVPAGYGLAGVDLSKELQPFFELI